MGFGTTSIRQFLRHAVPLSQWLIAAALLVLSAATCGREEDVQKKQLAADAKTEVLAAYLKSAGYRLDPRDASEVRSSALTQLNSSDPEVRFNALYDLARTAAHRDSRDALRGLLTSMNLNERLLAAESLIAYGDRDGVPVLIGLLDSQQLVKGSHPPRRVWEIVREALLRFTEEEFGLLEAQDAPTAAATRPAWESWWVENGESLRFDKAAKKYRSRN